MAAGEGIAVACADKLAGARSAKGDAGHVIDIVRSARMTGHWPGWRF